MPDESRKAPASKRGAHKTERRLEKLMCSALDSLEAMLCDDTLKASDRLSAVKLAFDLAKSRSQEPSPSDGVVKVVFEGIPEEWAE